jgi:hypothetical protein
MALPIISRGRTKFLDPNVEVLQTLTHANLWLRRQRFASKVAAEEAMGSLFNS